MHRKFKPFAVVIGLSFLVSCASLERSERKSMVEAPSVEDSSEQVESKLKEEYVSPLGSVAMDQNRHVDMWLRYFQGRGRPHMERYLSRSTRYKPMMQNVLREQGLPEELVYVALIESGFSPTAHSRANAVGYWQFIYATGKRFGLKIDGYVDERRDPVLATHAATKYFKTLYNLFGNWHLSMAAYNCGENRVQRAVTRTYSRDFWTLARKRRLPRETRNYVPKFIAAVMIAENPEKYGFTDIDYQEPLAYETVEAKHGVSLKKLAQSMSISKDELETLNPKFRGDYVPNYKEEKNVIRVPVGKRKIALASLSSAKSNPPKYAHKDFYYYRVRRGDTLSEIAVRNRTTVGTIRRLNRLGRRSLIRIGQRLRVPVRYSSSGRRVARRSVNRSAKVHVVRRGENLTLIARKYGTTVSMLKQLNKMGSRSTIYVGQRLKLRGKGGGDSSRVQNHKVRRGENLTLVARRYGTSVNALRRLNKLGSRSVIYVGQNLKVPAAQVHVVRRGETLSHIAERYNTSIPRIVAVNGLRDRSVIRAGSQIVIPD